MTFPFDITINLSQSNIKGVQNKTIKIYSGLTTFLGPNGSGKTQLLRGLKISLSNHLNGKKIRYVSAGRLSPMEYFRSDTAGYGSKIQYDDAEFGDKQSLTRRHISETVLGDFATLSERSDVFIKIQERLRKLFNRDLTIEWQAGQLKVFFQELIAITTIIHLQEKQAVYYI